MSTARNKPLISISEFLEGEEASETKHEFVDGVVYAMAGGSATHNRVATNVTGGLYVQLRGRPCQVFNSDMKVRIRQARSTRFYYPDLSVVCQPNPSDDTFQDNPVVVVEVLSESTRRVDEREKCDAYLSISSLAVYLLLETGKAAATLYRRSEDGFIRELVDGLDAVIELPEIGCALSMAEVYDQVEFNAAS